jgi:hypothetical protein
MRLIEAQTHHIKTISPTINNRLEVVVGEATKTVRVVFGIK